MNAGKTTTLLQASHNYHEHNMKTFLLTAALDTRAGKGVIASRIGLEAQAATYSESDDLYTMIQSQNEKLACVFVDEAQFLMEEQVWQLAEVVDKLKIPVMCYGLRTDFKGNLFKGSARLLAIADVIKEIKTICWCAKKATMVLRVDKNGEVLRDGAQIEVGGNDRYISLCRAHWNERMKAN